MAQIKNQSNQYNTLNVLYNSKKKIVVRLTNTYKRKMAFLEIFEMAGSSSQRKKITIKMGKETGEMSNK